MISFSSVAKRLLAVFALCILTVAGASAQWSKLDATMPDNSYSYYHSTAFLNGKLYAFGGVTIGATAGGFSPLAWSLDVSNPTAQWTAIASMPTPRAGAYAGVVNGKIYIIGGYYNTTTTNITGAVLEYDPVANTYTQKAAMPVPAYVVAGAVVGTNIYVFGGRVAGGASTNKIQVYDVTADSWETSITDIPAAVGFATASTVGNNIYLMGGYGTAVMSTVYKGTVSGPDVSLTPVASLPTALVQLGSGVLNGKLYVAGGAIDGSGTTSNKVFKYDEVADKWAAYYILPVNSLGVCHLPSDGSALYYISGVDNGNTYKFMDGPPVALAMINPLELDYDLKTGTSGVKTVAFTNAGIIDLTADIAIASGSPWLTSNRTKITVTPGNTVNLSVTANSASLTEGKHTSSLNITTNDNSKKDVSIPVIAWVVDNPVKRRPLLEVFTSSTCPPCKPGNEVLHAELETENRDSYTVLKYQQDFPGTGDPYATDETVNRRGYYGINSIPRMEVDGQWDQNAQSFSSTVMNTYRNAVSMLNLSAKHSVDGKKVMISVTANQLRDYTASSDLRLYVAICEKRTDKNIKNNLETEFLDVVKKMLPDENGLSISELTKGVATTKTFDFTFQGEYRLPANGQTASRIKHNIENSVEEFDDFEVVTWIQSNKSKLVLNSAWSVEESLDAGDQPAAGGVSLGNVVPNPANGLTSIEYVMPTAGNASVAVFNTMGVKVATVVAGFAQQGLNTVSFDTAKLPSGSYSVVLTVGDHTSIRTLTVAH